MWTVIIMEGKRPKRAIGRFPTREAAEEWAQADGWDIRLYLIVPFHD